MQYPQFCNVAFMLILSLLSTSGIIFAAHVQDNDVRNKLCTSEICVEAGHEIIKSLDKSVDPCNDFYQHACGGWIENHPIADYLESASHFNDLAIKSQQQLLEMINEESSSDSEIMRKVKNYYHSCNDLAAIDARGLDPLQKIVSGIGGWPLALPSDHWNPSNQKLTLQKINQNYAKLTGSSALFSLEVVPNMLDSSVRILHLRLPLDPADRNRWFMPRRIKRHDYFDAYVEYTAAVAKEFAESSGFNLSVSDIEDDIRNILEFGTALGALDSNSSSTYATVTIADVQNQWDNIVFGHPEYAINWLETIRNFFEGTNIVIDATEKIGLDQSDFIEKLATLLIKTPLRTVVNYVHWHGIDSLVPLTSKKMRDISNKLMMYLFGYEDHDEDRSIFCIGHHKMLEALSYVYVKKYLRRPFTAALEMVKQLQIEMKRTLDDATWMDNKLKLRLKEKIDNIVVNLGYPSWYDEPHKIDDYYSAVTIGPDYFENAVIYNRFSLMTSLKILREPYDPREAPWVYAPLMIGGLYVPDTNSINFPAVLFQLPLYHDERPMAMNYGGMGFLIGHEISHAVDDDDRPITESNEESSSVETMTKLEEKKKCFVDQYNNYTLLENYMNETFKIDGEKTLKENIADNTGFMIALKAYLSLKEHQFKNLIIPALKDYSDEQLFFYSMANFLCASARPEFVANSRMYTEHSSHPVRINGVLSNMPEFSQAFGCPIGSPMNPVKKCNLWD